MLHPFYSCFLISFSIVFLLFYVLILSCYLILCFDYALSVFRVFLSPFLIVFLLFYLSVLSSYLFPISSSPSSVKFCVLITRYPFFCVFFHLLLNSFPSLLRFSHPFISFPSLHYVHPSNLVFWLCFLYFSCFPYHLFNSFPSLLPSTLILLSLPHLFVLFPIPKGACTNAETFNTMHLQLKFLPRPYLFPHI